MKKIPQVVQVGNAFLLCVGIDIQHIGTEGADMPMNTYGQENEGDQSRNDYVRDAPGCKPLQSTHRGIVRQVFEKGN